MDEETAQNQQKEESSSSHLIPGSIILAGVIIAAAVFYTSSDKAGLPSLGGSARVGDAARKEPLTAQDVKDIADDDPFLGNPDAPVTIVEFSDFQCPFCAKFFLDTENQIIKQYVEIGKVKFVYRDFPLSGIHPVAQKAAEAAECAHEQGRFWEYHAHIFNRQNELNEQILKTWADELKLDAAQFNACLDSGKYFREVQDDYEDGLLLGVTGTPAVFVNGRLVPGGAQPFSVFQKVIEKELGR